jgi:hypothetical protein
MAGGRDGIAPAGESLITARVTRGYHGIMTKSFDRKTEAANVPAAHLERRCSIRADA